MNNNNNNNNNNSNNDTKTLMVAQVAAVLFANSEAFVYTKAMAVRDALELVEEVERQMSEAGKACAQA